MEYQYFACKIYNGWNNNGGLNKNIVANNLLKKRGIECATQCNSKVICTLCIFNKLYNQI